MRLTGSQPCAVYRIAVHFIEVHQRTQPPVIAMLGPTSRSMQRHSVLHDEGHKLTGVNARLAAEDQNQPALWRSHLLLHCAEQVDYTTELVSYRQASP